MKNNFKKIMGAILASAMLLSMAQTVSLAATAFEADFTGNQGSIDLVNAGNMTAYTYTPSYVEAGSGKDAGDVAYQAMLEDAPYTFVETPGLLIPFYQNCHMAANNLPSVATMEMSVKAPEGSEALTLKSYIAHRNNAWGWPTVHEFVKIVNGKVYVHNASMVAESDTGITVKPGEWVRIAVTTRTDNTIAIYINGVNANAIAGGQFYGYYWTQLVRDMTASETEGTRDVSVVVDDVKIYDGEYTTDNATATYSVASDKYDAATDSFTVSKADNMTVEDILTTVTADDKYVISSLSDNTVLSNATAVADGNVVVVRSADKKTFEYIYITVETPEPDYKSDITKLNGTGEEANDVAFYGKMNIQYADEAFGFKITLAEDDVREYKYDDGNIIGEVMFGIILRNLDEAQLAGVSAEYIK